MRIGIACYFTFGGSGVVATELGLALASRGHQIHILSYERPSRLPDFTPGVTYHYRSFRSAMRYDLSRGIAARAETFVSGIWGHLPCDRALAPPNMPPHAPQMSINMLGPQ